MRRVAIIALLTAFVGGGMFVALGAGSAKGTEYKIVFDNAFGLVSGADFKVGGVAVGSIQDLDVQRSTARAIVTVKVSYDKDGFSGLRKSAKCDINPQSLIGEYFIDCQPGTDGPMLKDGDTVPVEQTSSPIPPDLVLDIMRKPIAERFSIIFGELGVGFAARGGDVNETISRALPAIATTNDVLRLLARKRQILADLARESGQVLKVLGQRRQDVGDFVVQAKNTAVASADRRAQIAETFRRFPGFLDQLTPTMRDLGTAARLQTPALRDLGAAAPSLTGLLNTLRPFAQASLPAVDSLGEAGKAGRVASREARSLVSNLNDLGQVAPEPANNLRIVLNHLDDRKFAVEKDTDSPGGAGYTGLEAPLQYIFDQGQALNIFDQRGYSLKVDLTTNECSDYTDGENARSDPGKYARCNRNLGPNQPGITTPDPSPPDPGAVARDATRRNDRRNDAPSLPSGETTPGTPTPEATPAPDATPDPGPLLGLAPVQDLIDQLPQLKTPGADKLGKTLGPLLGKGSSRKPKGPGSSGGAGSSATQDLLDFLLSP